MWDDPLNIIATFLSIAYVLAVSFTVFVLILEDHNPLKTIAWLVTVLLLPVLGIILYLNFGRNIRKEKIFSRKEGLDDLKLAALDKQLADGLEQAIMNDPGIRDKRHIMKLLVNNSKALLTINNQVQILNDGAKTFNAIIDALQAAKHHIHLEYYIFFDDNIGRQIGNILKEKARQGVEVRMIYDAVGSWELSKRFIKDLKKAGTEVYSFMPVKFPRFTHKINYRNHRKILIVDGLIGFTGGLNVADRYIHGTATLGSWRDTHLQLEGDAVHSLQAVFISDWFFVSNIDIEGDHYFPEHPINKNHLVQITSSGPDSDWASIMQAYFLAIATAKDHIYISTPYFIPNESILTALRTAALGGADVRLLLPGKADLSIHWWSSMSFVEELLRAGVKVYLYRKGFNHSKLLMVDTVFSSVGTANMDIRSFDKNLEVNALLYDSETTKILEDSFLIDLEDSEQLMGHTFANRSLPVKIKEQAARLVSPLL